MFRRSFKPSPLTQSMSSYSPSEPADIINDEVAWLQGAFISSLLCGVQIMLSIISFIAVLKQRMRRRLRIGLLVYILILGIVMTAGQEVSLVFIQLGFIQNRNHPGGPNDYLSYEYNTPVYMASTTLFVIANWMMDSLLVWRCKVVCTAGDGRLWIGIILPPLVLASEYGIGAQSLYLLLRGEYTLRYAVAYSGLSLLLQFTVTAVLIESASLYTAYLVLFIIFFTVGTAMSNILQQAVAQVECIASLLIIYRIAQGKGWSEETVVASEDWRGTIVAVEEVENVTVEPSVRESPAETAQGQQDTV
ncbi:hypothetical protein JVU11DRAFT_6063 [Chiua virens]|nr:hypothetical protein JVU11DRAFT_6063 [Chiua virens]